MAKRWKYQGDVNLQHGGTFYDFSDWQYGYVSAVEVTNLDSAAGFTGAVLIEPMSIVIERSAEQLAQALSLIGAKLLPNGDIDDNGSIIKRRTAAHRFCIAYACQSYGYADRETENSEILQLDREAPMAKEGWTATKRLRANASLENYVRRNFLR